MPDGIRKGQYILAQNMTTTNRDGRACLYQRHQHH